MKLTPEIMRARLKIPEPTRFEFPVYEALGDTVSVDFSALNYDGDFQPNLVARFRFSKQLFRDDGSVYWAWTLDGKTPVFAIPMD